jgi:hypothetical protein
MLDAYYWNMLMVLKETTKAIFIILGDHRQCPPIEDGKEVDYFNHPYAKRLVNNNRCELTIPQRYDMKLWKWLEEFYEKGYAGEEISKKKLSIENILYRKNICYSNKKRRYINTICMEHFIKERNYRALPIYLRSANERWSSDSVYI